MTPDRMNTIRRGAPILPSERQQLVQSLALVVMQIQEICDALGLAKAHKLTDRLAGVALAELEAQDKRDGRKGR